MAMTKRAGAHSPDQNRPPGREEGGRSAEVEPILLLATRKGAFLCGDAERQ